MHVHVSVSGNDALANDTRPWDITGTGGGMVAQDPRLKLGDTGDAVKEAQKLLQIEVTGKFDPAMESAVRAFQAALSGLEVDGIVGPYTWRALRGEHPVQPATRTTELSPQAISAISALADASAIVRYRWQDRSVAPVGYIRGMAATFALVILKWKAGDFAARAMAAANTNDDSKDALSWYNSNFRALGMNNDVAGTRYAASPVRASDGPRNARKQRQLL